MFSCLDNSFVNNYTPDFYYSQVKPIHCENKVMFLMENLAFRISRSGLTLNRIAETADVSQAVLYKAVSPQYRTLPKLYQLERLAKFFKCTIDDLLVSVDELKSRELRKDRMSEFLDDLNAIPDEDREKLFAYAKSARAITEALALETKDIDAQQ